MTGAVTTQSSGRGHRVHAWPAQQKKSVYNFNIGEESDVEEIKLNSSGEGDKGIEGQSRVIDAIKDSIELQGDQSGRGLHFVDKEIMQYCGRILNLMSTK